MKVFLAVLCAIFCVNSTLVLADDSDRQALINIKEQLWPKAYREQDAELLDRLLHSSFQMIDAEGKRSTKANELEYVRTHEWNVENFRFHIQRLDIYDAGFAVIDGMGETDTYTYMSSNYLVKEDGRWQAIGSHVSGFKKK